MDTPTASHSFCSRGSLVLSAVLFPGAHESHDLLGLPLGSEHQLQPYPDTVRGSWLFILLGILSVSKPSHNQATSLPMWSP